VPIVSGWLLGLWRLARAPKDVIINSRGNAKKVLQRHCETPFFCAYLAKAYYPRNRGYARRNLFCANALPPFFCQPVCRLYWDFLPLRQNEDL